MGCHLRPCAGPPGNGWVWTALQGSAPPGSSLGISLSLIPRTGSRLQPLSNHPHWFLSSCHTPSLAAHPGSALSLMLSCTCPHPVIVPDQTLPTSPAMPCWRQTGLSPSPAQLPLCPHLPTPLPAPTANCPESSNGLPGRRALAKVLTKGPRTPVPTARGAWFPHTDPWQLGKPGPDPKPPGAPG